MKYSDLLQKQDDELKKLNSDFRENRDKVKAMITNHFNGQAYEPELQRVTNAYLRHRNMLQAYHEQQRKYFLGEYDQEPEKPRAKDMDTAYDKSVSIKMEDFKPETRDERIERKMREWQEAQIEKTQRHDLTQELG